MKNQALPRIYVASLTDYNNGNLFGVWIDATQDAESIHEQIAQMLKASKYPDAEEFAIHDFEGFQGVKIGEFESIETVAKLAELVEEFGEPFAAFWNNGTASDIDSAQDEFESAFMGTYNSVEDYVVEMFEGSSSEFKAPENQWFHPANFIDWERMGRDLETSGDIWTHQTSEGVAIFNNQ